MTYNIIFTSKQIQHKYTKNLISQIKIIINDLTCRRFKPLYFLTKETWIITLGQILWRGCINHIILHQTQYEDCDAMQTILFANFLTVNEQIGQYSPSRHYNETDRGSIDWTGNTICCFTIVHSNIVHNCT